MLIWGEKLAGVALPAGYRIAACHICQMCKLFPQPPLCRRIKFPLITLIASYGGCVRAWLHLCLQVIKPNASTLEAYAAAFARQVDLGTRLFGG